jgi:hypothetical protein
MLPISSSSNDPNKNLPLATFWFYRFTYTGFAKWMEWAQSRITLSG